MVRIARLVGLNAPQGTMEQTQSVSEFWASMYCWHRGNSTLCGVIGIVGNADEGSHKGIHSFYSIRNWCNEANDVLLCGPKSFPDSEHCW